MALIIKVQKKNYLRWFVISIDVLYTNIDQTLVIHYTDC